MTFQAIVNNSRTRLAHARTNASGKVRGFIFSRPLASAGILLFTGLLLGAGGRSAAGMAQVSLDYKPTEKDSLHLDGNLSGDTITAQGTRSGISAVNLSWKRKLKPRLSLTVSASDIYNGGLVGTTTQTASVSSVDALSEITSSRSPIVWDSTESIASRR
jgi:hypothetical protein